MPTRWREDPQWRGPHGGGCPALAAHAARFPSRWCPVLPAAARGARAAGAGGAGGGAGGAGEAARTGVDVDAYGESEAEEGAQRQQDARPGAVQEDEGGFVWHLVDYVYVPRQRVL